MSYKHNLAAGAARLIYKWIAMATLLLIYSYTRNTSGSRDLVSWAWLHAESGLIVDDHARLSHLVSSGKQVNSRKNFTKYDGVIK